MLPSTDDDPSFTALSTRLRQRIDDAFDSILSKLSQQTEYEAGGFIVEDVPVSSSASMGLTSNIPLSEIPRALKFLDLDPDEDLMGVFKNAATGWGAQNACNDGVSRKDWRAVCAALLDGEQADESDEENLAEDDSGPDSDEYQMELEEPSEDEEDSNDEYEEEHDDRSRRTTRKTPATSSSAERQLTASQKAQCRQDFARFFPHIPDNELDRQRIMIKDIARVADLLKENLKTEQILEMLEEFSSSPDKSMNLADFERMMVLSKMI